MIAARKLSLFLTPQGHLRLCEDESAGQPVPGEPAARLLEAFALGTGEGLFHLAAVEAGTPLPPVPAFWRELGHRYMTRFCGVPDLEAHRADLHLPYPAPELEPLLTTAPPMTGGEYLSARVLETLWQALEAACRSKLAVHDGPVQEFLRALNPVWNQVGRVNFHLAERKNEPEHPFAFLATYSSRLGHQAKVQHIPLARALTEYGGPEGRTRLLALLEPIQRACEHSRFLADLVDRGAVYHPLAWSPAEAHQFLKDLPVFEAAGIVVRVPDWWKPGNPARPRVQATVGTNAPTQLGANGLLDFRMSVALDGETLSEEELQSLLAGTDGLVLVKGRWVELDRRRLQEVLKHFEHLRKRSPDGITFLEGMRLLAGASLGRAGQAGLDEDFEPWAERVAGPWMQETLARLNSPDGRQHPPLGETLRTSLRPYQERGLDWLWVLDRLGLGGCLADDMGLGKTVQVIALLLLLARERPDTPHLLVVPASLLANWQAELERFAPSLRSLIAHPSAIPGPELASLSPERVAGHHVVLTSYAYLHRLLWTQKVQWGHVILDEAQAIKNPGTRQTRTVKALPARTRLALTGTPVENRLSDLWSIFDFLNPGLLGSAKAFGDFAKGLENRTHDQYGPLRRLVRPYILRRLKTDRSVISDLPEKTEMRAYCPLTKRQAVLYQQAVEELAEKLERMDGIERRGMILAFLTRFKQLCNHPSQWLGDNGWAPEESGKFGRLRELCEELASRQEKALVFTQYRETTEPLAAFLGGIFGRPGLVLHGQTPVRKRQELVRRFQEDEAVPFFVLSVKAGGTGLNLTAANHVIHFDRWWNPAVEDQATDRAFRIGQHRNVLVHKFVCRGTVEEKIDRLIESKQAMSRELLQGGAEAALTEMDNAELLKLVTLDLDSALEET